MSAGGLSNIAIEAGAKSATSGAPLLFYWHGNSAEEVKVMVPASVRAEILQNGGIIVSPQSSLGGGGDCSGSAKFSKSDFAVVDQIVACAVQEHNIDPSRIYTTGCSAGGMQATCLGAARSSYIAAVSTNSGGTVRPPEPFDSPQRPALMTMHGADSTDVVVVSFAERSRAANDHYLGHGAVVVTCNHGGGHCGAAGALQEHAWAFMKAHPFGVKPKPWAALPASFPPYCMLLPPW